MAIARVLLARKASLDHVSGLGWMPFNYIWGDFTQASEHNPVDFVKLLLARSMALPDEVNASDIYGWTLLHRVATYGTPEDINELMKLGASLESSIPPLQWTPLHQTAFHNKHDCFQALLTYYANLDLNAPDTRGWTLLHIAASAGSDDIVRHLLRLGADPRRESWPSYTHMPEILFGKRCAPAEVAQAQSRERYQRYVDAVREEVGIDLEDEASESFFDAQESIEVCLDAF